MDQGDVRLLDEPVAQALLHSATPARFGYTWRDGSPRVVAMWFDWSDGRIVMNSPVRAPKLKVLADRPRVALTIDDASTFPWRELTIRGRAELDLHEEFTAEYARAAVRYLGEEAGAGWLAQLRGAPVARISIVPEWVGLLDFETRFPSALG